MTIVLTFCLWGKWICGARYTAWWSGVCGLQSCAGTTVHGGIEGLTRWPEPSLCNTRRGQKDGSALHWPGWWPGDGRLGRKCWLHVRIWKWGSRLWTYNTDLFTSCDLGPSALSPESSTHRLCCHLHLRSHIGNHGLHWVRNSAICPSCNSCLVTWFLFLTPTYYFHSSPWSGLLSRAHAGLLLFPSLP